MDHVKSQGVRLVLEKDIAHRVSLQQSLSDCHQISFFASVISIDLFISQIFHIFGEILYERNIVEQEGWQASLYSMP